MKAILSPSLLSADFSRLGAELASLEQADISWVHLDIMDGHFVPNITYGAPVLKSLRSHGNLFFDVHLMIDEPDRYLEQFARAGADLLVAHLETMTHPQRTLAHIRQLGLKSGLALNPGTDYEQCRWLWDDVDLLLLMGVNPGFSGQEFIEATVEKLRQCRLYLDKSGHEQIVIQVDGGVNLANAATLVAAGADVLVSGSAFFNYGDNVAAKGAFDACLETPACKSLELASSWHH